MPKTLTVSATVPEKKDEKGVVIRKAIGPYTLNVQTGATAAEQVQLFGDEPVRTNADANWVITLQSNMRAGMLKGESQEALQARLGGAKMGVTQKGVAADPMASFTALYLSATPEKQKQMIAELTAKAAVKK